MLTLFLPYLLTERVKSGPDDLAGVVSENLNVIRDTVCREKPINSPGREQTFLDDPVEQSPGVVEEFPSPRACGLVLQNLRITAAGVPRLEDRRTLD
jgi:hypothetical protein